MTTGVTFAEISAAAASAWPLTSSAVIAASVVPSWSASARTCVWLVDQLVEELLLQVAAVVLRHLVQLVQRLVAKRARLDQRVGLGPGQQLLELGRRDRRQRPAGEADQLAGVAARAHGDRRRLHGAKAGGQVLCERGHRHLAAAHVAEQLHDLGLVAVDGGAGPVVKERGSRQHAGLELARRRRRHAHRHVGRAHHRRVGPGQRRTQGLPADRQRHRSTSVCVGWMIVGSLVGAGDVAVERVAVARHAEDQVLEVLARGDRALKILRGGAPRVQQVPGRQARDEGLQAQAAAEQSQETLASRDSHRHRRASFRVRCPGRGAIRTPARTPTGGRRLPCSTVDPLAPAAAATWWSIKICAACACSGWLGG